MKRRLSLLLAVVMILGSFSFAFAAEETAEEKAGAFLMKVGVLEGINGELKLEDNLRRQDAVVLVARLHGAEDEAKKFPTDDLKFTDFKDPFYRPIIAWAVANDLVEGHTPERFGFNEDVTAQQYATILLRALGYNDDVAGKDGYAKALELAKKLGVLENVEVENDTAITRGQMAVMTFNALGTKMKDSDKTLADKLGIKMPEPDVLEVVDVRAENLKEIIVELSNAKLVKDQAKLEDVSNYRTSAGKILDAKLVGNEVRLLLDDNVVMEQNKKYNLSIQDIQKEINIKKDFVAFDNTAPEIEGVTVLGTKGIRVTMSEPIKTPQERDFQLDGKKFVMRVRNHGRDITLIPYKEDAKFEEGEHLLTVGQMTDFAGFKSKEETHEINIVEDDTKPVVKNIVAKNNSVIVEFEEEVHPDSISKKNVSWTQVRGRKATEADGYKILSGNRVEYTFGSNKELPKPAVEVTVKGVENYSGYEMDEHKEVVYIEVDFSRPEIVSWRLLEDDEIEIVFSKELNEDSVEKLENYTLYKTKVKDDNVIKYAVKSATLGNDNKTVTVKFYEDVLQQGVKYILNVKDITDNTTLKNVMLEEDLEFVYGIAEGLEIFSAYTTPVPKSSKSDKATTKITLVFNNELVRAEAENIRNYELKTEDGTVWAVEDLSKDARVELYRDGRFVDIFLPGNGKVVEEVRLSRAIRDLYGNRPKETNVKLNKPRVKLVKAELVEDNKLVLTFNQDVAYIDAEKAIENIKVDGATIQKAIVKGGKVELALDKAPGTKVKVNEGAYILNAYDDFGAVEKEVEIKDVRGAKADKVSIERTGAEKGIVTVEFTNSLDPNTIANLKVKVADGKPVTLSHVPGSDYKVFEAEVDLPKYEEGKEVKVNVEVLTVGVKDLAGNSVKGKEFEGVKVAVENYKDKVAAKAVEALIAALPEADTLTKIEDVTPELEEQVKKAKEAFDALTEAQQELVSKENKDKLEAVINKIKELKAAVEEEPEPEITAKAVVENEALGVSKVVITVKGTTGEEVEKVLVNGSEVKIQRVEENKVTILSAKKVEKVEIVVAGEKYAAELVK